MDKTDSQTHKPRKKRWFRLFAACLPLVVIMAVILCNYTPRAYRPIAPTSPDHVSTYLTHELGPDFFNNIQLNTPFDLLVRQQGLNEILRDPLWSGNFNDFSFTDPMVLFDTGTIYLMGTLTYKNFSSTLTLIASPRMDDAGAICLHIQSVRMGILPVTGLVRWMAQTAFDQSGDCFEGEEDIANVVQAVIQNEPFDPVFELSGYHARITEFTLEPGLLTLRFQPL